MSEHPQVAEVDSQQVTITAPPEPRWPAVAAFVTAWLCPAISAKRTQHVSLPSAFFIHVESAILAFFLILWLAAVGEQKTIADEFGSVLEEVFRDWPVAFTVVGLLVLLIEGGFLALAFLVMPWGAGDEPLRSSFKHALGHTLLHSTHILPAILIVGGVTLLGVTADRDFHNTHSRPGYPRFSSPPAPPPSPATPEAMRDYQQARVQYQTKQDEAIARYRAAREMWEEDKPFLVKYVAALIMWSVVLCIAWILWALFRAVGSERRLPLIARPPTCEFCGYNLTGTAADGRCSECGELVVDSLGPNARPGTPWERRREIGRLTAWWRCMVDAIRRPILIGRQIKVLSHVSDHRTFLAMHLSTIFLAGAGVAITCFPLDLLLNKQSPRQIAYENLHIFIPFLAIITALAALGITTLGVNIVGLMFSLLRKRNLLPAAMQVAAYLGTFALVWATFAVITIMLVIVSALTHGSFICELARHMRLYPRELAWILSVLVNLPWLAVYLILLWKGTAAAQYANR